MWKGVLIGFLVFVISWVLQSGLIISLPPLSWGPPSDLSLQLPCSGNGVIFPGHTHCTCFDCFQGNDCEIHDVSGCLVDLGVGDPALFHQYWAIEKPRGHTSIPHLNRPLYRHCIDSMKELEDKVRQLHRNLRNVHPDLVENGTVLFAPGAQFFLLAALYAASELSGERIVDVYIQPPYYASYPDFVKLMKGYAQWGNMTDLKERMKLFEKQQEQGQQEEEQGQQEEEQEPQEPQEPQEEEQEELEEIDWERMVEVVTTPNNPDGFLRGIELPKAKYHVYDSVYLWPHTSDEAIGHELNGEVLMFGTSKLFGLAASRSGWAFVRDKEFAAKMHHFIFYSSCGLSSDAQVKLMDLLDELNAPDYFDYVKGKLEERWRRLREILSKDSGERFSIESKEGGFYLWIRCLRDDENGEKVDCAKVFRDHDIIGYPGPWYGVGNEYVRLNFAQYDGSTEVFFQRLEKIVGLP